MASDETHQPLNPPQPARNHPSTIKLNSLLLSLSCCLIVFIAISFNFTNSNYCRTLLLKSILSSHSSLLHTLLGFLQPIRKHKRTQMPNLNPESPYCVLWMAPFLSGGGYSSEAWSYTLALHEHMKSPRFKLGIEQHGDLESLEFWEGLPRNFKTLGLELHKTQCRMNETIVVCHSEPGAWNPPLFQTFPCPPTGYGNFMSVIGRTMFETDRVNSEHVKRCNRMDVVWVPTEFHVSTFIQSGVEPSKVVKIVQPIDVNFFNPLKYEPLDLASTGNLVLGMALPNKNLMKKDFVFLSIFKWEYRKGWDVLLKSYLQEFCQDDGVALYMLTNPYHSDRNFGNKVVEFLEDSDIEKPAKGWAPVYVIDTHITQINLPKVYKAADAFVLPSRGEGWGRPLVEAMAMSLPVIATNWSGPTEFLRDENSYPLPVDKMVEVMEGPFKGHFWAEPSVKELRILMRHVMTDIKEARAKGRKARDDMISKYSPEIVAGIVSDHLQSITGKIKVN